MLLINFVARSKIVKFILQDFVVLYYWESCDGSRPKKERSAVRHKWLKVIYMTIKSMSVTLEAQKTFTFKILVAFKSQTKYTDIYQPSTI